MSRIRYHKFAALAVTIGFATWIATGEFSSVGSAQSEAGAKPAAEEAKAPARTVAVVTPPRLRHARAIRISGQTEADQRAALAVRSGGIIDELPVRQGDRVKAGDLILRLADEEKAAAVDMAKAVLGQRQAEWEAAERLHKAGSTPKLQLELARSQLATAKSQLEAMVADLARNEVRAPFDGLVDRVDVERGAMIMQGTEVATIISLDPVIGVGEVSERDLQFLRKGEEAEVRLVNGETVKGTLRYISRDASAATRTFRVEVAIPNPDKAIPAGMTAEVILRSEPVDAVALPRSVVTLSAAGDLGIRAVGKDNKVAFYPIDLIDDTPKGLVLGGIPADARIIVAGQDLVTEGDIVNPVVADPDTIKRLVGDVSGGAL
ncbi:hemolysin D [Mesorhizobium sp. L-8-10]|uniref:efflux RND transporter periplasmic adaptor subunit n=1 Tax=Mesorhizobium sp. L-8-10 TaxID=2744523 RepID=UPI0019272B04|nr:efflux RND transporter periplasmic adaptor subunit [Mesorhizobium sp. L-8-10]BCH29539.1 hemolysin D [Mesorhizobium sp. L-8-10]